MRTSPWVLGFVVHVSFSLVLVLLAGFALDLGQWGVAVLAVVLLGGFLVASWKAGDEIAAREDLEAQLRRQGDGP